MNPKLFLIAMTAIAVLSDAMLHPFYPQYFATVFGIGDPRIITSYIATCSGTVLLAFPVWAVLSRRVRVLHLLIATQVATAVLCLVCGNAESLEWFWGASLLMMVFKASYLLVYPYALTLQNEEQHLTTISLLAFVVHSGSVIAAVVSGAVFEWLDPRWIFVLMAVSDALQTLLCCVMLRAPKQGEQPATEGDESKRPVRPRFFAGKLGLVMLVVYFAAYVTEPYFATYWEGGTESDNQLLTGAVFGIGALMALMGLVFNTRRGTEQNAYAGIIPAGCLAVVGLLLQWVGGAVPILVGRALEGWALFQALVRLDALFFETHPPSSYAVGFSVVNTFQGLGVLVASLGVGSLVTATSVRATFLLAAVALIAVIALYQVFFHAHLRSPTDPSTVVPMRNAQ